MWGINILYFSSGVFYVKALVEVFVRSKSKSSKRNLPIARICSVYHWALLGLLITLVLLKGMPALAVLAFAPVIFRGLWRSTKSPSRLNFKGIGWREVAYSLFFVSVTIWSLRAAAAA